MGCARDPRHQLCAAGAVVELQLRVERGQRSVRAQRRLVERQRPERVQQSADVGRGDRLRLQLEHDGEILGETRDLPRVRGRDPVANVDRRRELEQLAERCHAEPRVAVDEDVGLRPAGVVAAQLRRGVEKLLRPGDDVGRRVAGLPNGDACRRGGPDARAQPLGGLGRIGRRDAGEDDCEAPVVEPRDEVELARGADEPAERLVLVPPGDLHQHERERLVVLPRGRGEPAKLVVQVGLVVDAGERIAPRRLTGRRDHEHPAAEEQERRDGEDEADRLHRRLAAHALDDEDKQDHEQRAGHAGRGPDPQRRPALGPIRPPSDPEGSRDRRQADQAGLNLPAEVDEPA